jgi:membrane protein YqaA with SNARE-associated domain
MTVSNSLRGILKYIMDLWHQYRFLRFVKREVVKDRNKKFESIQSAYREHFNLTEEQLSDRWEEAYDNEYIRLEGEGRIRITAQGKALIGGGLYGFINAILREKGAPILFLSGLATISDLAYLILRHLMKSG